MSPNSGSLDSRSPQHTHTVSGDRFPELPKFRILFISAMGRCGNSSLLLWRHLFCDVVVSCVLRTSSSQTQSDKTSKCSRINVHFFLSPFCSVFVCCYSPVGTGRDKTPPREREIIECFITFAVFDFLCFVDLIRFSKNHLFIQTGAILFT